MANCEQRSTKKKTNKLKTNILDKFYYLRKFSLLILLSVLGLGVHAQFFNELHDYSDTDDSEHAKTIEKVDEGYLIIGSRNSDEINPSVYTMLVDHNGNLIEQRFFEYPGYFLINRMSNSADQADGRIWGTFSKHHESELDEIVLMEFAQNGDTIQTMNIAKPNFDMDPYQLRITSDNHLLVGGNSKHIDSLHYDIFAMKVDFEGEIIWESHFGGSGSDLCSSIIETDDGGGVVSGQTRSWSTGGNFNESDFYIVKFDSLGVEEWFRYFGTDFNDPSVGINNCSDGNFVWFGRKIYPHPLSEYGEVEGFWIGKMDLDGGLLWEREFGDWYNVTYLSMMKETDDGGFVLSGGHIIKALITRLFCIELMPKETVYGLRI